MTQERYKLFEFVKRDREENAKVLEKTSMKGVKKSIIEKYSEQAHFVYELLQNADDAKATKVRFILDENGLLFAHNGKIHFSISDPKTEEKDKETGKLGHINSITSIGNTTKFESEIGKFGLGFKSVFQYTNMPCIYDPPFMFKIERFIVPVLFEGDHPERVGDETLFYLPFYQTERLQEKHYEEVNTRLQKLNNPLLFLRHLEEIEWKNSERDNGIYLKDNLYRICFTKQGYKGFSERFPNAKEILKLHIKYRAGNICIDISNSSNQIERLETEARNEILKHKICRI